MNECLKCGAHREWKTRRDTAQSEERKFLSHPKGGCHGYINDKLGNRCNLFEQDFRKPKTCEDGCGRQIYCFEIKMAPGRIYFDTLGPPWVNHSCQARENPVQPAEGYKPCVIDTYISVPWRSGHLRLHFLGFQIQIETNGFRRKKAFVVVSNPKDNKQFVDDLHQPFFYKEIGTDDWVLSTYQVSADVANGRLLYTPKEYICRKFDHESIKGWKSIFGDEKQHCLDLRSKDLK